MAVQRLTGIGVWSHGLRFGDPREAAELAAELDELGYAALWIPDVGGPVFDTIEMLLSATRKATIATGILNLWMHSAEETAAAHARLTKEFGERFLVGIGVSHDKVVDADEPGRYARPMAATRNFLDALDAAPKPLAPADRVLAALGPKMLELGAARSSGVHPYNVTPEHTAIARAAVGDGAQVLPSQAVVLTKDADEGRALGRGFIEPYLTFANYVNNWRRLGFEDKDFADGGSDRLVDAIICWGDESAISARVEQHLQAGADHVCVQVLSDGMFPTEQLRALAPALVGQ